MSEFLITKKPIEYEVFMHEAMIDCVDARNREAVLRLHRDHWAIISHAPGSTHNHQAWEGGYLEHIMQVNRYVAHVYRLWLDTGVFDSLPPEERFELADALTVSTLHDIEKPFATAVRGDGTIVRDDSFREKPVRAAFRDDLLKEYEITFDRQQTNAFRYAEGMRDADYTPSSRVMLPMAALVHTADLLSARGSYNARILG